MKHVFEIQGVIESSMEAEDFLSLFQDWIAANGGSFSGMINPDVKECECDDCECEW